MNYNEFRQFPIASISDGKTSKGPRASANHTSISLAAGAMVFAHNKVLLNRSDESDLWSVPGGIVDFEHSCEETVVRKLKEELNLQIEVIKEVPPYIFNFSVPTETGRDNIFLLHFLVKVTSKTKIKMGGDVIDYKWESIAAHFRDAYPNVKYAVDHFMKL